MQYCTIICKIEISVLNLRNIGNLQNGTVKYFIDNSMSCPKEMSRLEVIGADHSMALMEIPAREADNLYLLV